MSGPESSAAIEPLRQLGIMPALIAGWSAFPAFMLLLTSQLNHLYTQFAPFLLSIEMEPQNLSSFLIITFRVLLLLFCCRNMIAFSWDVFVDSVRQYPTMNPLLFRNSQKAARALGCGSFPARLMVLLHLTSAISLICALRLARRFKVINTENFNEQRIFLRFTFNLILKTLYFINVFPNYQLNVLKSFFSVYVSFSDVLLVSWILRSDIGCLTNNPGIQKAYPWGEANEEYQRQILTLNFLLLVIVNVLPFCLFSILMCRKGVKVLEEPQDWTVVMRRCRNVSMAIVVVGWGFSLCMTGLLPSFFSLCLLINGISLNRFLLSSVVESIRFGVALWIDLKSNIGRALRWLVQPYRGQASLIEMVTSFILPVCGVLFIFLMVEAPRRATIWTCLRLAIGIHFNILYKYQVQATRWGRRGSFFQHGIDVVIFLPLASILAVAVLKAWGRRYDFTRALKLPGQQNRPASFFRVAGGAQCVKISSIMGTLELSRTNVRDEVEACAVSAFRASHPSYTFCNTSIGGASLLDYSLISLLSYLDKDSSDFHALFDPMAATDDWELEHEDAWGPATQDTSQNDDTAMVAVTGIPRARVLQLFSPSRNLSVIAVAGTNPLRPYDIFQDVLLFHRAFTFELASQFSPPLKWIPQKWKSFILSLSSLPLHLLGSTNPYWYYHHTLIEEVKAQQRRKGIGRVVLTGHSLGGAIAQIVAAGAHVPVVSISSPGVSLLLSSLGIDPEPLKYLSVNVVHENDVLPMLDKLMGTVFILGCGSANPFRCHQPGQTICELLSHCKGSSAFIQCRLYQA